MPSIPRLLLPGMLLLSRCGSTETPSTPMATGGHPGAADGSTGGVDGSAGGGGASPLVGGNGGLTPVVHVTPDRGQLILDPEDVGSFSSSSSPESFNAFLVSRGQAVGPHRSFWEELVPRFH